jgi:23S rRNA (adenine2030-N6)-methyltransferase
MHYRHAYHAGNFADVFKHVVLCGLLQALQRKDKPWSYLETHAGAGLYDLSGEAAGTTAEWRDGIGRLKGLKDVPEPLAAYLSVVRSQKAQRYPGSPLFAQALGKGRLVLCEKVPEVCAELKSRISAEIHQRDGYEAHALLPPREKRGLILIDPPFEARDEFTRISEFLTRAMARFAGGVYAVWYPLKNRHEAQRFTRRCARELPAPALNIEFETGAVAEGQMRACGLLVINPPFRFEQEMAPALKLLASHLAQGPRAGYTMGPVQAEIGPTASAKPRR